MFSCRRNYNEHWGNFIPFKKNENDDLEELKYVEQQNSDRNKQVALMRFEEQIDEKVFTEFLRVRAEKITLVVQDLGPRHIFEKMLYSDHFDQHLKHSVCEKANEFLYKFCIKHPQIKHFYNKTIPAALIISWKEAAFECCWRSYLQEKYPSFVVQFTVPEKPARFYFILWSLNFSDLYLTHIELMFHFWIPWKILWFSYVSRMPRNGNGLRRKHYPYMGLPILS